MEKQIPYSYDDFSSLDMSSLKSKIESITKELENDLFWEEFALFEKILMRSSRRIPKDRFLNRILKVNTFIKRLKLENLSEKCNEMLEMIRNVPFTYEENVFLPSSNCFSNFLLHFQRMAFLLAKTASCCEQSCRFLLPKLQMGHLLEYILLLLSLIARIYTLCKIRCLHLCLWYKQLYPWMKRFKSDPDSQLCYKLPRSLKKWIQKETDIYLTSKSENELNKEAEDLALNINDISLTIKEDIGELVTRNEVDSRIATGNKKQRKKRKIFQETKKNRSKHLGKRKKITSLSQEK